MYNKFGSFQKNLVLYKKCSARFFLKSWKSFNFDIKFGWNMTFGTKFGIYFFLVPNTVGKSFNFDTKYGWKIFNFATKHGCNTTFGTKFGWNMTFGTKLGLYFSLVPNLNRKILISL